MSAESKLLLLVIRKVGVCEEKNFLGRLGHFSSPLSCAGCCLSNTSVFASISFSNLMKDKQLEQPREIDFITSFSGGYV